MNPHNLEAEQSVLGSAITNQDCLTRVVDELTADMFHDPRHKIIYGVLVEKEKADLITVCDALQKKGQLGFVGAAYVAQLAAGYSINFDYHIKIVKDIYKRRLLYTTGEKLKKLALQDEEVPKLIGQAEELVLGIGEENKSDVYPVCELVSERWKDYETRKRHSGVSSGFYDIDDLLTGFQPSELIVLAARPSLGKTALALNMAVNTAKHGNKVLIFSLEMAKEQLIDRMICAEARINSQLLRLRALNADNLKRTREASERIMNLAIMIDDSPDLSVGEMRSKARRIKKTDGLDVVFIDYLTLIKEKRMNNMSTNDYVGEISRKLKNMARELKIPVVVLSQLSRAVEGRQDKRPMLSDLRDSGAIEQDADVVMFIYREDYYRRDRTEDDHIAEIIIAKQRNGPLGTVKLRYDREFNKFESLKGVLGGIESVI